MTFKRKYNPISHFGLDLYNDTRSAAVYFEITYEGALAAMDAGSLVPGATYKINDRGDRGLFFTAISTNQFSSTGTRLMLCPATYDSKNDGNGNNWLGIWHTGLSPSINDLVIWGAHVWKNITGLVGSYDDDKTLDNENWVLIPKSSFYNNEYITLILTCSYDFLRDCIFWMSDAKGNYFNDINSETGEKKDLIDYIDWNFDGLLYNFNCFVSNNLSFSIANNFSCYIYFNKSNFIESNLFCNITNNNCITVSGNLSNNIFDSVAESIANNRNRGDISVLAEGFHVFNNSSLVGSIMGTFIDSVTDVLTDKIGS